MPAATTFGEYLRRLREQKGLTQQALGDLVGCSVITIRKIEGGERRPSVQMAELLAQRLGVPPGDRPAFLALARSTPPPQRKPRSSTNLPDETFPLIGRTDDLEAVLADLRAPETQLVTLSGSAGVGKTRLALAVGRASLDDYPDGVWFVPLSALTDDQLVLSTINEAVGVRRPSHDQASGAVALTMFLRKRRLLLILDNFEHVLGAAPFLPPVLAQCPGVRILVTSRETTHLPQERLHRLAPLTFPRRGEEGKADAYTAVALFVACAQASQPTFSLTPANAPDVGELCLRLDGLPLAIELVAPRVRILSPRQLLDRLTDESGRLQIDMIADGRGRNPSDRHSALEGAMAWSYGLLSPTERTVFRRLGVFSGTWSVESAEAVCRDGMTSPVDVWNALASLIDKSLVHQFENEAGLRFSLLDTVREYARLELDRAGEASEIRRKHVDHFLAMAEAAGSEWIGADEETRYRSLELELDNLRAALEGAIVGGDGLSAARLAIALHYFWQVRGAFLEGHRWLTRILAMDPGDAAQGSLRIQLEDAAGLMTLELGMPRLSEAHYNNALALSRAQGDRLWTARSLSNLGRLAIHERDPLRAQAAIEESLAIFEELGDRRGVLVATTNMSLVEADLGNFRQSATRMEACVDGWRSMGWNVGIAVALTYLGAVQCAMGDYKAGNASLQEALAITRTIDAPQREVDALINLGIAALHQGRLVLAGKHLDRALALSQELGTRWSEIEAIAARSLLAEITGEAGAEDDARAAEAAARAIGDRLSVAVCLHVLGRAALRRGDLGAAATHIAEGLRQHVEIHNPAGVLLLIETAAELAAVNGDPETAARLFAGADGLRSTLEIPRAPVYHQPTRQAVTIARRRLGKPSFETGWKAGRSLTIDDAAALADRYLASVTGTNDPSESP